MKAPDYSEISPEKVQQAFEILKSSETKAGFIERMPESGAMSKQESIHKLIEYFESEKLVLVLGAGVSLGFGLPGWNVLLQKLMITTIEQEEKVSNVLSRLFTNVFNPSPLIAGRYLQQYFENREESFEEEVRKVLYQDVDLGKGSRLMDEIINLCAAPGKSPNLDSIITYNFDDLLEQRLESIKIPVPYKSIFGIGMNTEGQLPIYHVHGFLPQSITLNDQNQITLGESIYHKQYNDIYSWNNIVQINKFREANCLFIGTSLTDPNQRRLLDIAKKQKGEKEDSHFIIRIKHNEAEETKELQKILAEDSSLRELKILADLDIPETVRFLINIIERFEETDTASFGVKTIWVDDPKEIPDILKAVRLRKKGGNEKQA
jgi:hypothetical protein